MPSPYTPLFNRFGNIFGVDPAVIDRMAMYESGYNAGAMNNWDTNAAAGTPSGGIMQFIEPTFNSYYDQARAARPGVFASLGRKSWMDPAQQIATAAWAVAHGKGDAWTTYDRALAGADSPRIASNAVVSPPNSFVGKTGAAVPDRLALAQMYAQSGMADEALSNRIAAAQARQATRADNLAAPQAQLGYPVIEYGGPTVGGWQGLQSLGQRLFGLRNDPGNYQTFGGIHSPGSLHGEGKAIDFGSALNTPRQLNQWWDYLNANRAALGLQEILWEDRGTSNEHIHAGLY